MIKKYSSPFQRRKAFNSAKVRNLSVRPRLMVFRSNNYIYAQIVDSKGNVLASSSDLVLTFGKDVKRVEKAYEVGKDIAVKAKTNGVEMVAFDRGAYKYHGRVKSVCEGARSAGLIV